MVSGICSICFANWCVILRYMLIKACMCLTDCGNIFPAMEEKLVLDRAGVEVLVAGGSSSKVQEELHDHNPSTSEVVRDTDLGIEERKLKSRKFLGQRAAKDVVSSMQMNPESAASSSPSSTGKDQNASKLPQASSPEYMEDQNEGGKRGTARPIRVSFTRKMMVYSPDSRPVHCDSTRSSNCPSSREPYIDGSLQNLDTKKEITESAREIMALTNRDYHGSGRHPPPINNGHPLSQQHEP
ncbi:uncharacterized protein LOC104421123 [Eucalyptus grandis]|uniref:uncharacterized protein LOC104421123 n=1 Tax=Eucalyptus grandis TaxID=71139 RepID=UPI00192EE576|nr:uncharacterized protein LOC104421123 [Eucalyptus grandis]